MMTRCIFFLITLFVSQIMHAQVIGDCTAPYDNPEELVEILVGEGVEFFNVTFSGFDCSAGFFDGNSNIGFQSGIAMATDGIESITPGSFGGAFGGAGIDADLTEQLQMVGASATNLNNLIILEFDFIPTSDIVTFDYVFASNEYPSFTCSQYNDIFGFFLSGPGINGPFQNNATNIALVPDPIDPTTYTNTPVIINTINSGVPSFGDSAPCDDIDPNWQDYSIFFTDNSAETTVSYPGFTVPLVATANVTACDTFHLKLAIADVADGSLNSAVFLQENSFNSAPPIEYTVESNVTNIFNADSEYINHLYEGCGTAMVTFQRPDAIQGDIAFEFDFSGDALNILDYNLMNLVNNQLVMEDGMLSVSLEVNANNDSENEGVEQLLIKINPVDYGCYETDPDTVIFELHDQPDFFIDVSEDMFIDCPGDEAILSVQANGGVGGLMEPPYLVEPYTYQWYDLGTQPNQTVYPTEAGNYCVQVTDICEKQASACIFIDVATYEDLTVSSDLIYVCEQELNELCVDVSGGNEQYTFLWSNGSTEQCMQDTSGTYSILVTDGCGIQNSATGEIRLDEAPDPVFIANQLPNENYMISISNLTSDMFGLSYSWNFGDGYESSIEQPQNHVYQEWGEYEITLGVTTLINNCFKSLSQMVQVAPLFYFYAPNSFTPNGDGNNDTFIPSIVGNETIELFIYDRWGREVFYTNDLINNQWDGNYNNVPLQIDSYTYRALIKKYFDDTIYEEYGYVNLLR